MAEEHQPDKESVVPQPQPEEKKADGHHNHPPHHPKPMAPPTPKTKDQRRTLCTAIAIFLLLVGLVVLVLWLVYRPHKPQFTIAAAAVYELNNTSPPYISTSMRFTIVSRNPNRRVSIIYDKLTAYVSYRNQAITPPVSLPPLHQETKTTVALSPVLGGAGVPVSGEVARRLVMDEAYGVVALRVVVLGRLRWKAGIVKTGRHGLYVRCDVWVGLKKGLAGPVPLLSSPQCKVDI